MGDLDEQTTRGFSTRAIHAGQQPDPSTGAAEPYGPPRTADQRRADRVAAIDCALAVVGGARLVVLCSTDPSDSGRDRTVTALAEALVAERLGGDDVAVEAPGADGRGAVSVVVLEAVDPEARAGEAPAGEDRAWPAESAESAVSAVSPGPAVPAGRGGTS